VIKWAECKLKLTPGLRAQSTRIRDAEAAVDFHAGINLPPSELPNGPIELVIQGKHADVVIKLLSMLKDGKGDTQEIIDVLRGLASDSDSATKHGNNPCCAA